MKIKSTAILITCAILCGLPSAGFAQRDVVDKIIAVVGDQLVLASELASQIQLYSFQTGQQSRTEEEFKEIQDLVLEQMINDQLFLLEAQKDTLIVIRDEEIETALRDHVARLKNNFDSEQDFMDALAAEGLTIRDLKKKYRNDVRNQLLRQRFIQRKLYSVSISRHEVGEFYKTFQDSIPSQPEAIKLAHLLLTVQPSKAVEDSVRKRGTELRQMILDGADFAAISAQHSTGGAGANGGDLGFISRDDVVPEFGRAAFNLSVGDISGVIRTAFGYHVIKCEGKKDDRLLLRHLLLEVIPSADDSLAVYELADSLLASARNGSDFAEIVKIFSADNETRATAGELGWFAADQLPQEFVQSATGWTTAGEYKGPIQTRFGIHLLKLLEHQQEKKFNLAEDYDRIKELARQDKTGQMVDDWIVDIKSRTFIDIRI